MGVTAIYELPVPIWISTAILGERIVSGWGRVAFDVYMPTNDGLCGGPPTIDGVALHTEVEGRSDSLMWTQRYAAWPSDPASTTVCRVVVQTRGSDDPSNTLYELARVIDHWFDMVRTWAECVTGQDLDPNHRVYSATSHGARLTVLDPKLRPEGHIALTLTTPHVNPVSAAAWRGLMARVSDGEEPPLEEVLSRDARAALARGQTRRSVIDAASAVEMVLFRLIDETITEGDMPNGEFRRKLKKLEKQPLGELVAIAEKLSLNLGADFNALEALINMRNGAIHRGEKPRYNTACTSVQTAINLLGMHGRWKRPGDLRVDGSDWIYIPHQQESGD